MSDVRFVEGELNASGLKFGIVVSRFNEFINGKLLGGSLDYLKRAGTIDKDITVVKVPGTFEIPIVAKKLAESKKYNAIICLGTIIRGETNHFDLLSAQITKMISEISVVSGVPLSYGIITAESIEQAIARAGTKMGNKGFDAAMSAVEMATLLKVL